MVDSYMWGIPAADEKSAAEEWENTDIYDVFMEPEKTSAFERQEGGNHYKKVGQSMQPWAIIDAWNLDFYAGNVLKYLLRYQYKDGLDDLKKARHYLDRMIEKYDENPS